MARALRQKKSLSDLIQSVESVMPSDDEVVRSFEKLSVNSNPTRRYLLVEIEKEMRATEEILVGPPSKVHVEHIYPQTPEPDDRFKDHASLVNRLGNLSLLSKRINTSIKNASFLKKRDDYAKSDLLLTNKLIEWETWGSDEIEQRQDQMATHVASIWKNKFQ